MRTKEDGYKSQNCNPTAGKNITHSRERSFIFISSRIKFYFLIIRKIRRAPDSVLQNTLNAVSNTEILFFFSRRKLHSILRMYAYAAAARTKVETLEQRRKMQF